MKIHVVKHPKQRPDLSDWPLSARIKRFTHLLFSVLRATFDPNVITFEVDKRNHEERELHPRPRR